MSDQRLGFSDPRPAFQHGPKRISKPLGRHLVDAGEITTSDLLHALAQQEKIDAPLGDILVAEGLVSPDAVMSALASQHGAERVNLAAAPPDRRLHALLPLTFCIREQIVPWLRMGNTLLVATAQPDKLSRLRPYLPKEISHLLPVIASKDEIIEHYNRQFGTELALRAETALPQEFSCRTWQSTGRARIAIWLVATVVLLGAGLLLVPHLVLTGFVLLGAATMILSMALKLSAYCAQIIPRAPEQPQSEATKPPDHRLPCVSVIVPLFHEKEIARALVSRLERLTYPKAILDVVLVLEERDDVTRKALEQAELPAWMRVIEVADTGGVTTKPRALNYALGFCRGSIIGVWDAEDAPEVDQIEKVVAQFAAARPDVACVQGVLDYYNAHTNWMARCFTIEYAAWWRFMIPGLSRLGYAIPLGGTTLFFRRSVLEDLGGWDAHNVTEDADLGIRLARFGYRTELLPSVTHEEACCRPWPWVRQRSRWLKGFMVTYLLHLRAPRSLLADLGVWRYLGFHVFFITSFSQFLLAPFLWSFWLILFGLPHPIQAVLPYAVIMYIAAMFLISEILAILVNTTAVSSTEHRRLLRWVPTMMLYFPLGTLAAYKALYELIFCPFYWDKTQHGQSHSQT